MIEGTFFAPPSPPHSPCMASYNIGQGCDWTEQHSKSLEASFDTDMSLLNAGISLDEHPPVPRQHKSFPYTLKHAHAIQPHTPANSTSPTPNGDVNANGDLGSLANANISYGGSAPVSPANRLTPTSDNEKPRENEQDTHDFDCDDSKSEDEEDRPAMSAAELRAQKRKMKRFRLTHNQTRFLMSEFARQAHPDAAHRERLAREIPGLSPRQVQVWFQNRRAKLKRLTSDDRERMMLSRALPDDFDMTQALHSPFGAQHNVGAPLQSSGNYTPAFPEGNMIKPLTLDTLRKTPDGAHMSPTGITPSFGNFTFTPPQSATETSPVSANADMSPFNFGTSQVENGSGRPNPFGAVSGGPRPGYLGQGQIPRLHDRMQKPRADSASSPLRASVSYTSGDFNVNGDALTATDGLAQFKQRSQSNPMVPYGIGHNYSSIPGFQAAASSRMRSFSSAVPRRLDVNSRYVSNSSPPVPHTATFPNYQSSPLETRGFEMPPLSAPHNISAFQNPYMQQGGGQHDGFSHLGFGTTAEHDSGMATALA